MKKTKKIFALILSMVLVLSSFAGITVTAVDAATDIIPAIVEGFESSIGAIKLNNSNATSIEQVDGGANGSAGALKVTTTSWTTVYEDITFLPGVTYNISVWLKYTDKLPSQVSFLTRHNGTIADIPSSKGKLSKTADGTALSAMELNKWYKFTASYTTDVTEATSSGIVIRMFAKAATDNISAGTTVYMDEFMVEPIATDDILRNGNFDESTSKIGSWASWATNDWTEWGTSSAIRSATNFTWQDNSAIGEGNITAGSIMRSRVTGNTDNPRAVALQSGLDLEPGKTYAVSAMFKSALSDVTFSDDYKIISRFHISYNDPNRTKSAEMTGTSLYAGGSSWGYEITKDWKRSECTFEVPAVSELKYMVYDGSTYGSVYADKLQETYGVTTADADADGIITTTKDSVSYTIYTKPYIKFDLQDVSGSYTDASGVVSATLDDPIYFDEFSLQSTDAPGRITSMSINGEATENATISPVATANNAVAYMYKRYNYSNTAKANYIADAGSDLSYTIGKDDVGKEITFYGYTISETTDSDGNTIYSVGKTKSVTSGTVAESTDIAYGTCGDNMTWKITAEKKLIVSGSGKMSSYPWSEHIANIEAVELQGEITSIATYAFRNNPNLKSVTLNEGLETIGTKAFQNTNIKSVIIPSTVKTIGDTAFGSCGELLSVSILSANASFTGDDVFAWSPAAFNCYVGSTAETYAQEHDILYSYLAGSNGIAQGSCGENASYELNINTGVLTISGSGAMESFAAPAAAKWHYYRDIITTVVVEDGITSIADYALYNCDKLTNVTIADSVTSIGEFAFQYCGSLAGIELPVALASIGTGAFYGCTSLTNITIPESVKNVGDYAFKNCPADVSFSFAKITLVPEMNDTSDEFTVKVSGTIPQNARIIVALYNTEEMIEAVLADKNDIEDNKVTFTFDKGTGFVEAKAFLFENLDDVTPMCSESVYTAAAADARAISTWGDSLTAGSGGSGTTYPSVLAALSGRTVTNRGIGGEDGLEIAARQGSMPAKLSSAVTIPAGVEAVEVPLVTANDTELKFMSVANANSGINPCSIGGITGSLSSSGGKYYFTRSEAGTAVEAVAGTELITNAASINRGDIGIIFCGQNSFSGQTVDTLLDVQQNMIDYIEGDKEYIVIGLTTHGVSSRKAYEDAMSSAYGNSFINMRDYISSYGVYEMDIEPTADDLARMEVGAVPPSLLNDSVHFNSYGYKVLGRRVYNKLVELGY